MCAIKLPVSILALEVAQENILDSLMEEILGKRNIILLSTLEKILKQEKELEELSLEKIPAFSPRVMIQRIMEILTIIILMLEIKQ